MHVKTQLFPGRQTFVKRQTKKWSQKFCKIHCWDAAAGCMNILRKDTFQATGSSNPIFRLSLFYTKEANFWGHHALTASALLRYPSFAFTWSWKTLPFSVQLATDNVHGNQIKKSSSKWQITRKKMWWKWILYLRIEVISDDEDNGPCMPQPVVDLA